MNFLNRVIQSESNSKGGSWTGKLIYCQYKENSSNLKYEWSDILSAIREISSGDFFGQNILTKKVKSISTFSIELPQNFHRSTERLLAHHFVELETYDGFAITFEKNASNILVQSCLHKKRHDRSVRWYRNGVQRSKLETMALMKKSIALRKEFKIGDIFEFIHDTNQLGRAYHYINANCQEFVKAIWNNISSDPIPLIQEYSNRKFFRCVPGNKSIHYNGLAAAFGVALLAITINPSSMNPWILGLMFLVFCVLFWIKGPGVGKIEGIESEASVVPSITHRLLDFPVIFSDDWKRLGMNGIENVLSRFLGGSKFVAEALNGQVVIWGGKQGDIILPPNCVYFYQKEDQNNGVWTVKLATGEVPEKSANCTSAVSNDLIYIFGGIGMGMGIGMGDELSTELSTLSSSGHFARLHPTGDIRSPRGGNRGFSSGTKVYFFGGMVHKLHKPSQLSRADDFVQCDFEEMPFMYFTNELHQYDPDSNAFQRIQTSGVRISPRLDSAIASRGNSTFIHGGFCNQILNDFYMLNMDTFSCTRINDPGFSSGPNGHSLSPISSNYLLLIGSLDNSFGSFSNHAKIFDIEELEWDEVEVPQGLTKYGGLNRHKAVATSRDNGATVICIGGSFDDSIDSYLNHILMYDISFTPLI